MGCWFSWCFRPRKMEAATDASEDDDEEQDRDDQQRTNANDVDRGSNCKPRDGKNPASTSSSDNKQIRTSILNENCAVDLNDLSDSHGAANLATADAAMEPADEEFIPMDQMPVPKRASTSNDPHQKRSTTTTATASTVPMDDYVDGEGSPRRKVTSASCCSCCPEQRAKSVSQNLPPRQMSSSSSSSSSSLEIEQNLTVCRSCQRPATESMRVESGSIRMQSFQGPASLDGNSFEGERSNPTLSKQRHAIDEESDEDDGNVPRDSPPPRPLYQQNRLPQNRFGVKTGHSADADDEEYSTSSSSAASSPDRMGRNNRQRRINMQIGSSVDEEDEEDDDDYDNLEGTEDLAMMVPTPLENISERSEEEEEEEEAEQQQIMMMRKPREENESHFNSTTGAVKKKHSGQSDDTGCHSADSPSSPATSSGKLAAEEKKALTLTKSDDTGIQNDDDDVSRRRGRARARAGSASPTDLGRGRLNNGFSSSSDDEQPTTRWYVVQEASTKTIDAKPEVQLVSAGLQEELYEEICQRLGADENDPLTTARRRSVDDGGRRGSLPRNRKLTPAHVGVNANGDNGGVNAIAVELHGDEPRQTSMFFTHIVPVDDENF